MSVFFATYLLIFTAFSIYLGLRTVRDIPDCPKPRVNYLGLRAVSVPAGDIALRYDSIGRSSSRSFHAEAAFNPTSHRERFVLVVKPIRVAQSSESPKGMALSVSVIDSSWARGSH